MSGKKYVTDGATIKCIAGSKTVKLKVTNNRKVTIKNKKIATLMDFAPMVNIKPFGTCKILTATVPPNGVNKPCVCPIVAPWLASRMMVNLKNFTPLLDNSKLICTIGGVITIKNPR